MNTNAILSRKEVERRTSFSRTSIYRMMGSGTFPRPIRLSANRVGWLESDIDRFLEQRIAASRGAQ